MKIKAVDLFCGAGGVTRGLLDAGIDVIAGFDIDPSLEKVYQENNIRPNGKKVQYNNKKVEELTLEDIEKLVGTKEQRDKEGEKFLLAGCAPCQPFSLKNKDRLNPKDPRRTLLKYFADLVDKTLPDFVFMENVAGIANLESDVLSYFMDILEKHKYKCDKGVLNALQYGVPQNRKRYVLLASKEREVSLPKGLYDGKERPFKTVEHTIKDLPKITAGETTEPISNHISPKLAPINLERIRATKPSGGRRKDWPERLRYRCHYDEKGNPKGGHSDIGGRMDWKKPAPTLTTRFTSYTTGAYGHPEQDRAISLKEGALLQSFPNDYIFYGTPGQIARQIGNAVPPKMAEEFGQYFISNCNPEV